MFVDEATIKVTAGRGGDGMSSFRREKYVAKGGPDGGDGGDGGSIIFKSDHNTDTLSEFRYSQDISAEDGEKGKKARAHGKNGQDRVLSVPVGTVVFEGDSQLADLDEAGVETVVARGGRGGYGNAHFKSSRRQAPRMAELGEAGEAKELRLELKTVADVGLVGLPNAGKSTLLSVISNAKPKVADYPFTTLTPNLGVVKVFDDSLIFADIPGLIEGASQGKGLGVEFLRHVERTKVLLHLIDGASSDVAFDYSQIQTELANYEVDLSDKPQIVALTKADFTSSESMESHKELLVKAGVDRESMFIISSVARKGMQPLLSKVLDEVKALRSKEQEGKGEVEAEGPTITLADDPSAWWVEKGHGGELIVCGEKIERFAERTDFSDDEAMRRLRDIFRKQGIDRELVRQGAKRGDEVSIGDKVMTW